MSTISPFEFAMISQRLLCSQKAGVKFCIKASWYTKIISKNSKIIKSFLLPEKERIIQDLTKGPVTFPKNVDLYRH